MYFKIATNNVKKSFKDYSIYFLTLTFAVCIFYSFNSIGNQNAIKGISEGTASYLVLIKNAMSIVSVFVSLILGGLIIYANNFLIKKRKKELGTYMMLGMGKRKISQILVTETLSIGVISLVVGLGLGIILSQGLSIFTAKLFELNISQYKFSMSMDSIVKTIIYFGIIFALVMIFNVFVINKYKLIDLLTAYRKNEKITVRNPFSSFIIFIVGILFLSAGYYSILKYGIKMESIQQIGIPVLLGVIGTFLFFFGISGFILYIVKKNKKIYLKGLNIFITKQISSKMNTNFVSMSIISLMLFVTIVALSSGLGLKNSIQSNLASTTPFSGTIDLYDRGDTNYTTVSQVLKDRNIAIPSYMEQGEYETYDSGVKMSTLLKDSKYEQSMSLIPLSQYNRLMEMEGKPTVTLGNNEALLTANSGLTIEGLNKYLASGNKVTINGEDYRFINKSVLKRTYQSSGIPLNMGIIIVPDKTVKGLKVTESFLNLNYKNNIKEGDKFVESIGLKYGLNKMKENNGVLVFSNTKTQVYEHSKGSTTVLLFITIYLGVIFLLTSAAVLALQQLSEASDSIGRYKSLKRIGVSDEVINKSIFYQTFIYFGAPLFLAIVDSVIGLIFTNNFIVVYGEKSILGPGIITFVLLMVIYLGYFIATYLSYKNIIRER